MKQRLSVCLVCVSAFVGVSVAQQDADTVPSYLLTATERPFAEFMMLLANASIRSGLEVKEVDNLAVTRPPSRPKGGIKQVPRELLIEALKAQKPRYQASWVGDVLVIRPATGRVRFLDSASPIQMRTTVVGVMQALRTILSPLDERLLTPGVGTGKGFEALKALTANITLDGSNRRTVIDTLNQVVSQNQGAWRLVTRFEEDDWRVVELGFTYSDFVHMKLRMPQK
jgi:hypothetical protein